MGRTIPSYRWKLDEEIASWKNMRDFLRIDERELFDDLMNLARERASEAGAEELIPSNHVSMQPKQQFTQQCSSARKYGFPRIL